MGKEINIFDVYEHICDKCEYGDSIEKLNEYERVFFVAQVVEAEVNNGGFLQFFDNSSGNFANEIVDSFTKIGALKTAKICEKAVAVFNGYIPTDRDERGDLLESLDCDEILDECDDEFYEYEDNLEELNIEYIKTHSEFFEL